MGVVDILHTAQLCRQFVVLATGPDEAHMYATHEPPFIDEKESERRVRLPCDSA
jgi:hypothetical protein